MLHINFGILQFLLTMMTEDILFHTVQIFYEIWPTLNIANVSPGIYITLGIRVLYHMMSLFDKLLYLLNTKETTHDFRIDT